MAVLSLRLPDSLHRRVREVAKMDGISINQFVSTAVAEKLAALDTVDYLRERARRADIDDFSERKGSGSCIMHHGIKGGRSSSELGYLRFFCSFRSFTLRLDF